MIIFHTEKLFDSLKSNNILIPIVVNTYGRWEMAENSSIPLGNYFTKVKNSYELWSRAKWDKKRNIPFELGETQIIECENERFPKVHIANMLCQNGIFNSAFDVASFDRCISSIMRFCEEKDLVIYATKNDFGPGDWNTKEDILSNYTTEIHIYE